MEGGLLTIPVIYVNMELNMILTTLALIGLLVNIVLVISFIGFALAIKRKGIQYEQTIRSFVSAPDAATPSPLAVTVDQIAQVVARAVIVQAKTSIMGESSAVSKAAARADGAQLQARLPWLGALASISPGLAKSLVKNPALLNLAAQFAGKARGAPPSGGNNGGGHVAPPQFDL